MKEQALKIVSDLIDGHKISGREAITLISAILNDSNTQYIPASPIISQPIRVEDISRPQCGVTDVVINPHASSPYPSAITTTVTGNTNDITTSSKGMEVIYG
jgi:hypothetical protein